MKTATIEGQEYGLKHATETGPVKHDAWGVGDAQHQGDVIIVNIGTLPRGAKKANSCQVVPGETQGSRHVVKGGKVYEASPEAVNEVLARIGRPTVGPAYVGRVFEGPCVLTHPEHRHHEFPESVNVALIQRNLDAEEREAAVRD